MKIKFLGTAAAEGIPALFCSCDTCKTARKTGGKEIRTRSQAIINDTLMIDFPPETYAHSLTNNIELSNIHHYLITHTHEDHFYPQDVTMLGEMFSNIPQSSTEYFFYGSTELLKSAEPYFNKASNNAFIKVMEPYNEYKILSFAITPLKATHNTESPFIYIIDDGQKRMLYAHDTGIFCPETEEYLYTKKPYFDLISFDCCCGTWPDKDYGTHLSFNNIKAICKKMKNAGIIDNNTKLCCNHFSHNASDVLYKDRSIYEDEGFIMTYDGFEIDF